MKKVLFLGLCLAFFTQNFIAQEAEKPKEENKKLELKPYGFVKGDMIMTTGGVYSFGSEANCYISSPQIASGKDTAAMGFTSQHTRFGLKGSVGEEIKATGLIEMDFFGGAMDANIRPRVRLAYASVATKGFEMRMGQQWDLFSPNNANTNNTNGNMWYAGNRGFRRPQLQLSYTMKNDVVAPMVQLSLGETSREDYIGLYPATPTAMLGTDNQANSPMIQARISGTFLKKYVLGFSLVNASYLDKRKGHVFTTGTRKDTLSENFIAKTSGICIDLNLPVHKFFTFNAEFNTGTNLNNANLFNIAGAYAVSFDTTNTKVVIADKKVMGMWFNASSKITDWFEVVVGYGMDQNQSEKFAVGNLEKNSVFYADLVFPIKHGFSVALEFQNISTTVAKKVVDNKITERSTFGANVINLSAKVNF